MVICDDENRKASLYIKDTAEMLEILKQPAADNPEYVQAVVVTSDNIILNVYVFL